MTDSNYSVHSVHKTLLETFHQYLSAQYHIWDEGLIAERNRILSQIGNTYQDPRLEATPQYAEGRPYAKLAISDEAREILTRAATQRSTGIPKLAYAHQCRALEAFSAGRDLIVATGTGSGKTESFLMPILCNLASEAAKRPESWKTGGVRAILLYPMNALVNDQLARLRRLIGSQPVRDTLSKGGKRLATFGMYTSRSPYPGRRDPKKDKDRVEGELNQLYFDGMTDAYRELLQSEGKWPKKDLEAFRRSNLTTGLMDSELLTRHEMQILAPDVLVTNYSMLEYMMLRPLEAPIFQQTADWLSKDSENQLVIVLDEAHMYRGSGGAEVAYLLRRLQSRLNVPRSRIRFVLTSASLGSSDEAKSDIKQFAARLTGGNVAQFELETGTTERRTGGQPADLITQQKLASFEYSSVVTSSTNLTKSRDALLALASDLEIQLPAPADDTASVQNYAFQMLDRLPVASLVSEQLTSVPTTLADCARIAFPAEEGGSEAIEALLALMAFAKDVKNDRPYCPIRSHLFFRGLPGLFACTNTHCSSAVSQTPRLLGRLHPSETLRCDCGARVYELLTHRSCGASYLRAFMQDAHGDFLWHQPSNGSWTDSRLIEAQFYVVPEAELESARDGLVWLHTPTGKLVDTPAHAKKGEYLALLAPKAETRDRGRPVLSLKGNCPACGQRTRSDAPLAMDLATKGEAPFAHLVRAQVETQPLSKPPSPQAPNGGRKTIIFSDGRQKAARLARDIPREIELDVFRQAIFMASRILTDLKREPRLNENLYVAFLKCLLVHDLRFFDGDDRLHVEQHLDSFVRFFDGDVEEQLKDDGLRPPPRYWEALLRQMGTPFYSVSALTLGYVVPTTKPVFAKLRAELTSIPDTELEGVVVPWIQRMLGRFAFGREIPEGVRSQASRYPLKPSTAADGFSPKQRDFLSKMGLDVSAIAASLATNLCESKPDGSLYLKPSHLVLKPAIDAKWVQCSNCKSVSPLLMFNSCPNCLSPTATIVTPDATSYLRARKGFWRDPVARVIAGTTSPMSVDVQEHTAQLSHKDANSPSPTTEIFERRFRDILKQGERAVDVLSCTTTMEVGIDIGSLIAVSMRNVPPMRQNYQQRAGRAGRRGSAVSTVLTYAQSGAHDSFYFLNPEKILAGDPPKPVLDTSNSRIADRHVLAQLLQDFFRPLAASGGNGDIYTALGDTWTFYSSAGPTGFDAFKKWVRVSVDGRASVSRAQAWLPDGAIASSVMESMICELEAARPAARDGLESSFIEFLFSKGLLPSYAFPTDLCSLQIQEKIAGGGIRIVEQAQQGLNVALSEYAPGRLVVVNKKTYRIGTVAASGPDTEVDRAAALFDQGKVYRNCTQCSYTAGFIPSNDGISKCPQCDNGSLRTMTVIRPETVYPSGRREIDEFEDQVFTRVTQAQLPLADEERTIEADRFGARGGLVRHRKRPLVVVNEGDPNSDDAGFNVCRKCGKVLVAGEPEASHYRDYYIRAPGVPARCDGEFEQVFLGYGFISDVLLLRIDLRNPLRFGIQSRRDRKPIEDALQTLCEALTLSIGRVLDVDTREVSAGYRFGNDGSSDFADIFIYDVLAGGAGYALQAGDSFDRVFHEAKRLMSACTCTVSCENCLRHYGNRFSHTSLDRHLGLVLAGYIETGAIPAPLNHSEQIEVLKPLTDLVNLAGWSVTMSGSEVLAAHEGKTFRLEGVPSLRASAKSSSKDGVSTFTYTPYELARDLPSAFAELK